MKRIVLLFAALLVMMAGLSALSEEALTMPVYTGGEEDSPAVSEAELPEENFTVPVYTSRAEDGPEISEAGRLDRYIRHALGMKDDSGKEMAGAGGVARDNLTNRQKRFYDTLVAKAGQVASGQVRSTVFTFEVLDVTDNPGYTASDLGLRYVGRNQATVNALAYAVYGQTDKILRALYLDNPYELYWYDNVSSYYFDVFNYEIKNGRAYLKYSTLVLQMDVIPAFSATGQIGTFEINTAIGQNIAATRNNAMRIVAANKGKSDYQKLRAYADAICEMTEYDYDSAYNMDTVYCDTRAWTMINALDGNPDTKTVCQGYSEAFQYLCDLSRFNDVRVVCIYGDWGDSRGSTGVHMWNIVRLDGQNYVVDITHSDGGNCCDYEVFMKGYVSVLNGSTWVIEVNENDYRYYTPTSYSVHALTEGDRALALGDYWENEDPSFVKIREFVARCYRLILNRDPDGSGLEDWVFQLKDRTKTASEIIYGFIYSTEFTGRRLGMGSAVEILYQTMLNRESDAAGKMNWLRVLLNGGTYTDVINGFCGSGEFTGLCREYGIEAGSVDTGTEDSDKVRAFVRRCYRLILKRDADETGLKTWTLSLKLGTRTAAEIIHGFMYSEEYINRNMGNRASIEILYQTMLNRNSDETGMETWLKRLSWGETIAHVINGFCESTEFKSLCRSYGITPGTVKAEEATALTLGAKNVKTEPEGKTVKTEPAGETGETAGAEKAEAENGEAAGAEKAEAENEETAGTEKAEAEVLLGEAVQESAMDEGKAKEFVSRCYRAALGREAVEAELAGWVGQIVSGEKSPEKIVRGFLLSDEFRARNLSHEETVKILYRIYMNREADPEGLSFWTLKLDEGMSPEDAVKGFAGSEEFRNMMKDMKR